MTRPSLVTARSNILATTPFEDGALASQTDEKDGSLNNEETDEIIMAVTYTGKGSVGCAYFVSRTTTLYLMEDIASSDASIVDSLKLYIDPSVVLLPASCSPDLVHLLDPNRVFPAIDDSRSDCTHLPYLFESRPSSEFAYQPSLNKLLSLVCTSDQMGYFVPETGHTDNCAGKLLRLAGLINLESRLSVGCAGAVLSCRRRRGDTIDEASNIKIGMFSLADTLLVNSDTLHSLQIIMTDSHPNAQQPGSKEGLSIYGLFHHHAHTPQGRARLRQYFLRPSTNTSIINERLDTISMFLQPENIECLDLIVKHLSKIKNMHIVMDKLQKGITETSNKRFSSSVWTTIRFFAYHTLCITDVILQLRNADVAIIHKIQSTFNTSVLAEVGHLINSVIDLESSHEQHRVVIHTGVDNELDAARRVYEGLDDLLTKVVAHFANSIPVELKAGLNVIYFPQIGFLLSVRIDSTTGRGVYEGVDDDVWEKVFTTEAAAYYKNAVMLSLDREYGDVYGKVCDREIEIIQGLAERILSHRQLVLDVSDTCAELDCLTAFARGAIQYGLCRPQLTEDIMIHIRQGRHLLQELTVPAFVANDTHLDEETNMVILTGPNFSGKSIYLKQVALIVYMSHIGSFVPAEAAIIGLTDKILTRIATRESLSRASSAFMIDLQQISVALNLATSRSLLIIDEFGKGTDSNDGAGLVAGVLQHLLNRIERPQVLAATHFHEIFESGFLEPQQGLEFAHMRVLVNDTAVIDEQVTHLYTLTPGRSIQSFGTICAALNGVPALVVQRAERFLLLTAKCGDLAEACAELPDHELQELEDAEAIARNFLMTSLEDDAQDVLRRVFDI